MKNRPYSFQYSSSSQDIYHFSCSSQFEVLQWINVFVRVSQSNFERARRVPLIAIKREKQEAEKGFKKFILSSQQLEEEEEEGDSCIDTVPLLGMKEAKYFLDRPSLPPPRH